MNWINMKGVGSFMRNETVISDITVIGGGLGGMRGGGGREARTKDSTCAEPPHAGR